MAHERINSGHAKWEKRKKIVDADTEAELGELAAHDQPKPNLGAIQPQTFEEIVDELDILDEYKEKLEKEARNEIKNHLEKQRARKEEDLEVEKSSFLS